MTLMGKGRLEAFSDGVIAIIITIMVLELKIPHGTDITALLSAAPEFIAYILSFIYIAIYWNNHHHMMHTVERVNGCILWANMHLLFWLSLIPVATGWIGENHFAPLPSAFYGLILLMAAIAYWMLQTMIVGEHGRDSFLAQAIGKDVKGKVSILLYMAAILLSLTQAWAAHAIYVFVALLWLVPDRRIENQLRKGRG